MAPAHTRPRLGSSRDDQYLVSRQMALMNILAVIKIGLLLNALVFFSVYLLVLLEASGERRQRWRYASEFIPTMLLRFEIKVSIQFKPLSCFVTHAPHPL